jgi:hypothetical protein
VTHSEKFGFNLPDDVAIGDLEALHDKVTTRGYATPGQPTDAWREWADGINGVMYRVIAADAASDAWILSMAKSDSPPLDDRVQQERALFEFYSNAFSVLECLGYALSAMAELVNPQAFLVTTSPREISFRSAVRAFSDEYPMSRLAGILSSIDRSQELADLRDIRNTLSHRGAPARTFSEVATSTPSGGSSERGSTTWLGRILSPATTADLRIWVVTALNDVLRAANEFADAYL